MWRIRKNRELRELYKEPDIVAIVKIRRLRWAGHVERREEESMLKKIANGQPRGTRPLGRPNLRWRDQVQKDLHRVGASLDMAADRQQWRQLSFVCKHLASKNSLLDGNVLNKKSEIMKRGRPPNRSLKKLGNFFKSHKADEDQAAKEPDPEGPEGSGVCVLEVQSEQNVTNGVRMLPDQSDENLMTSNKPIRCAKIRALEIISDVSAQISQSMVEEKVNYFEQRRMSEDSQARATRLEEQRQRDANRRAAEEEDKRARRLEEQRQRDVNRRAAEEEDKRARRLEEQRQRDVNRRAAEEEENRARRLEEQRQRDVNRRAAEEEDKQARRLEEQRQRDVNRRAAEEEDKRARRLEEQRQRDVNRRAAEEEDKRARRLEELRQAATIRRAAEEEDERVRRLEELRQAAAIRRAAEDEDEHVRRLEELRQAAAIRRAAEEEDERVRRLEELRQAAAIRRAAEEEDERVRRLEELRQAAAIRRAAEDDDERVRRLEEQRQRDANRRDAEVVDERAQRLREQCRRTAEIRQNSERNQLQSYKAAASSLVEYSNLGMFDIACVHCGAVHFLKERVQNRIHPNSFGDCCLHGRIEQPAPEFPNELALLYTKQHRLAKQFHDKIRNISACFAFSSFNVADDRTFNSKGIYTFTAGGQVYHKLNLAAQPVSNSEGDLERPRYGQITYE
ncbi:trichohyalin-like [Macrosteles quadrilineatus]|uniref:trichohyalin-like n=1 Tax=Macrosteles quadrilineatus TaxID=74068 RepID=UPI0023E21945|nr:trichohyalin-like [Macrosteles quadrilineatus]